MEEDWGIKFNYSSGEPAPEKITDEIYGFTQTVSELKMADIPDVDLSKCGVTKFGDFEVEVIDPVEAWHTHPRSIHCAFRSLHRCVCYQKKQKTKNLG